jgi:hypothetical protein
MANMDWALLERASSPPPATMVVIALRDVSLSSSLLRWGEGRGTPTLSPLREERNGEREAVLAARDLHPFPLPAAHGSLKEADRARGEGKSATALSRRLNEPFA